MCGGLTLISNEIGPDSAMRSGYQASPSVLVKAADGSSPPPTCAVKFGVDTPDLGGRIRARRALSKVRLMRSTDSCPGTEGVSLGRAAFAHLAVGRSQTGLSCSRLREGRCRSVRGRRVSREGGRRISPQCLSRQPDTLLI
jgi:hypothetical protein